ncbi:MAG: hypothetical protein SAK29_26230 [Scytonema sp. PMC 1069.18]|nr:hypothetical protein [Scytonema sp. PMC 1069.18]MEC4884759.1 hypothetical protein [Scytonema sp. PMC 1070.18]
MMNDEQQMKPHGDESQDSNSDQKDSHPLATGLGVVGGGVAGAALGRSVGGKAGAALGGVVGAIAGGVAGNKVAEYTEEVIDKINPSFEWGVGANNKPVELPSHYSWEELQALSKPQGGKLQTQ